MYHNMQKLYKASSMLFLALTMPLCTYCYFNKEFYTLIIGDWYFVIFEVESELVNVILIDIR